MLTAAVGRLLPVRACASGDARTSDCFAGSAAQSETLPSNAAAPTDFAMANGFVAVLSKRVNTLLIRSRKTASLRATVLTVVVGM